MHPNISEVYRARTLDLAPLAPPSDPTLDPPPIADLLTAMFVSSIPVVVAPVTVTMTVTVTVTMTVTAEPAPSEAAESSPEPAPEAPVSVSVTVAPVVEAGLGQCDETRGEQRESHADVHLQHAE